MHAARNGGIKEEAGKAKRITVWVSEIGAE